MRESLKKIREEDGLTCSKCRGTDHYWVQSHKSWVCKSCKHETRLTAGTVMHGSKLPLKTWFKAIHLIGSTKTPFSAKEMQRQLGHKRYQPIWEMMHKLRDSMGVRDGKYVLRVHVELEVSYVTTGSPKDREAIEESGLKR